MLELKKSSKSSNKKGTVEINKQVCELEHEKKQIFILTWDGGGGPLIVPGIV